MKPAYLSIRFPALLGFSAFGLLVAGVGFWSVETEISGAVIATGTVQVENQSQIVQHPDGGVVDEILFREGDRVASGNVLIRLDGTFFRTELSIIEAQLADAFAQRGRLIAERDGLESPVFSNRPSFETVDDDALQELIDGQSTLFQARAASLQQETEILGQEAGQISRRIEGIEANINALFRQQTLIEADVEALEELVTRGLSQVSQLNALLREEARLNGEVAQLQSEAAEAGARIQQIELERVRLTVLRQEQAIARLRELDFSEIELLERRLGLLERLERLDIRAPVGGTVFGMSVFAERSVVSPAEPIMYIVPDDQPLQIEARIDPIDVDQVQQGQEATLVFSAFNRRETPEVQGQVVRVSADAAQDQVSGRAYYEAIVIPEDAQLAAADGLALIPGMPVEVYLETSARTPLSYLVQPLAFYFRRAFREE